jgi:hypothetical protein
LLNKYVQEDKPLCVLKYEISDLLSNDLTIKQNYFAVADFIKNGGGNEFEEIQYWAISDIAGGDKVISFTLTDDVIQKNL